MTNPRQRYKHEEDVEPCCGQPSCSKARLGVGDNIQDCFNVATRLSRIVGTRFRCFPRALWKKLCACLSLVNSVAFFSTSSLVELLLVVWLFRAVLPTFLAVRVCLGSADMVRRELLFVLFAGCEGCRLGVRTPSEERRSGDPRFGGGLPAVKGACIRILSSQILFKRGYADAERAWTHRWKRGGEAVVVVVAVNVPEWDWD